MYSRTATAIALAATAFGGGTAYAATTTVNDTANVVFIVDESGSMGGEQSFLENTVVDELDSGLQAAGVTNRSYAVIGFGGNIGGDDDDPRLVGGLDTPANTKTNLGNLTTSGAIEDGYAGMQFALDSLNFDAGAAVNFILATDEDRDTIPGAPADRAAMFSALSAQNVVLNAIVDNPFTSDTGTSSEVIGLDADDNGYLTDGSGGFTTDTNPVVGNGAGSTDDDYVGLALDTGGAAWNLNILRAGGSAADSFASAFVDIKVAEITTQPPTPAVPVPASIPLLVSGLGMIGALRLRAKRA